MDILRKRLRSPTSGIVRLLIAVGILLAGYFFVLRPVLRTTDDAVHSAGGGLQRSFAGRRGGKPRALDRELRGADRRVQAEVEHALRTVERNGSPKRLLHCVKQAAGNRHKVQSCVARF